MFFKSSKKYSLHAFIKKLLIISIIIYLTYIILLIFVISTSIKKVNGTFSEATHAEHGITNGRGSEEERLERYNNAVAIYESECNKYHRLCEKHPITSSIAKTLNNGIVSDDLLFIER